MKRILLLVCWPACLAAQPPQPLPDSTKTKINNLFSHYGNASPGCAVAILQKGAVVFQQGYGLANLEYATPIAPTTVFHIASESKQYVAFCILLLEKEGKLSLDDDIRKHLNYVPDFGRTITIRHLVYHTSGLRDQWQLLANAGWQLDDVITQEHILKLVARQQALNFSPGEEYMYCNTGYTLLAEIVKKTSGLSLREYADKQVFRPLGMNDTHFHDNYQELVPGRAYSYSSDGRQGYRHAVLSYSVSGATSLFTTVADEAKWLRNFETGQVGGKELIEKMHQTGMLNNGRQLDYAFALVIDTFKGWKWIGHGGSDAGFRTYACRFPELELGIVVFSNYGSTNPTRLALQIAELLIPQQKAAAEKITGNTDFETTTFHQRLQGNYYSERGHLTTLVWSHDKLIRTAPGSGDSTELRLNKGSNGRYPIYGSESVLILDRQQLLADSVTMLTIEHPSETLVFKRNRSTAPEPATDFTGKYFSRETEAFYTVTEQEGSLVLTHRKFDDAPLNRIAPDQFTSPHWWIRHIRFIRDRKGKVVAFEVNAGRILKLRYDKVRE